MELVFVYTSQVFCSCAENDHKPSLWWEVEKVEKGREELYLDCPNLILMWM